MGAVGGLSGFFERASKEIKTPKVALSEQTLNRLIEAGEVIHTALERLPRKIAVEYKPGFNRLIALIDSHSRVSEKST